MPRVDLVALVRLQAEHGEQFDTKLVAWESVEAVGAFAPVPGRYPPLYRPGAFPTRSQWDALEAGEI